MRRKLKIIAEGMSTRNCKVFLDDLDVTTMVREITLKLSVNDVNTAIIEFIPAACEFEGLVDMTAIGDEVHHYAPAPKE